MKSIVTGGWVLLGLELLVVAVLFFTRNMGDDAAGRGMARGFALLLGPIVLVAGGLLIWGTRGGPKPVLWVALAVIYLPVAFGAFSTVGSLWHKLDRTMGRAQFGRFDDARLTKLGRAISRGDTADVRTLLAAGVPDWSARDRVGQTLLGHAIVVAIDDFANPNAVRVVNMLIDAGAPVIVGAIAPEPTQASVSRHNLVYHLYGVHNASALAILDRVLSAGLSPNVVDEDNRPIYFSTYTVMPALEILAKHGADFSRLDVRSDMLGQNGLMNAISMQMWDAASFFLAHGNSPDYVAPDGRSARTILAEVDPPGSAYYGDSEQHHADFIAALARWSATHEQKH